MAMSRTLVLTLTKNSDNWKFRRKFFDNIRYGKSVGRHFVDKFVRSVRVYRILEGGLSFDTQIGAWAHALGGQQGNTDDFGPY